jgi:hypothetical protein
MDAKCQERPHAPQQSRGERGFDFLGYHFSPEGLSVATKTIENFIEKASRLYEQKCGAVSTAAPLEMYVRRWLRWSRAGLKAQSIVSPIGF